MQEIPVRKHSKERFSGRKKTNNVRAEVERNIRHSLATGRQQQQKLNELLGFHRP